MLSAAEASAKTSAKRMLDNNKALREIESYIQFAINNGAYGTKIHTRFLTTETREFLEKLGYSITPFNALYEKVSW